MKEFIVKLVLTTKLDPTVLTLCISFVVGIVIAVFLKIVGWVLGFQVMESPAKAAMGIGLYNLSNGIGFTISFIVYMFIAYTLNSVGFRVPLW